MTQVLLSVTSDQPPETVATWLANFELAQARLRREGGTNPDHAGDDLVVEVGVDELMRRWGQFNATTAPLIRAAIKSLVALGYSVQLPESRAGGTSDRTYAQVVRSDGSSLGNLNSSSINFVGAARVAAGRPGMDSGRYPRLAWTTPGAVEIVVAIGQEFLRS